MLGTDGPTPEEIKEFGDPSTNAKVEPLPTEYIDPDPSEVHDDELADEEVVQDAEPDEE